MYRLSLSVLLDLLYDTTSHTFIGGITLLQLLAQLGFYRGVALADGYWYYERDERNIR